MNDPIRPPAVGVLDQGPAPTFPPGFLWGAATAAYQIEGAATEGGRAPSIWDTFSHTQGRTVAGHTGDVACDHYHRMPDDVRLMADLGLKSYRFSVSWPRVQPGGSGAANPEGLDFYRRLVDELLGHGIEPWLTLYHWDLPQPLEDAGGWPARDTAARFADYARLVADALGDRVRYWTTLNEPWCSAFLGYGSGVHAPGRTDGADAVRAGHHLMLGHGLAVQALRATRPDAQLGITVNLYPVDPASTRARRRGRGPADRRAGQPVLPRPGAARGVPRRSAGGPGGGHRLRSRARRRPGDHLDPARPGRDQLLQPPRGGRPGRGGAAAGLLAGVDLLAGQRGRPVRHPGVPVTDMDWEIDAPGLLETLERVHREYTDLPLYVTENGSAFVDAVVDGRVDDADRLAYFDSHLRAAHA